MTATKQTIIERIHRIKIMTSRLAEDLLAGAYHSAFKGKGMEFEEVREYSAGDEVRNIDWNVTARMQRPFIKIFREEREISVVFLIDISHSTFFGRKDNLKRDYIAELAAILAFSANKNNDKVGALYFADQVEKVIAPRKSFQHVMHILDDAMTIKPEASASASASASALTPALKAFNQLYPRRAICFVISDFLYDLDTKLLALIASKHDLIALIVYDEMEKNFPEHNALLEIKDLESGKKSLLDNAETQEYSKNYRNFIATQQQKLLKAGASVINLNSSEPYLKPLQNFFRLRSRRK